MFQTLMFSVMILFFKIYDLADQDLDFKLDCGLELSQVLTSLLKHSKHDIEQ